MKYIIILVCIYSFCCQPSDAEEERNPVKKTNVKVDNDAGNMNAVNIEINEKTALAIAKVIILQVYGESCVDKHEPYKIKEKDNAWVVRGSSPHLLGGAPIIEISKKDAQILFITHTK